MSNADVKKPEDAGTGAFLLGLYLATGFWLFVLFMTLYVHHRDVQEGIDRGFRYHDAKTGELIWRDEEKK